jgi:acyl dehydratase
MAENSEHVTEELKALVGSEMTGEPDYVDRNDIRFYAEAIRLPNPPNPLYVDEVYARRSARRGLVAPPTYMTRLARRGGYPWAMPLPDWLEQRPGVNAGAEVEMVEPIHAGDVIRTRAHVVDVYEREGSKGKLLFLICDFEFTNQLDQYVGKTRRITIKFPGQAY